MKKNTTYNVHEISEWDVATLIKLTTTELTPEESEQVQNPPFTVEREQHIMALHWHPETIPFAQIKNRIQRMFPNASESLIIPTQHNLLTEWDGLAGVEVDSYSREFNRKVQLLFHFTTERIQSATTFKAILSHTYKYRSSQFYDFLDTLTKPQYSDKIDEALRQTELDDETLEFVLANARKFRMLFDRFYPEIPEQSIKNKLISAWFMELKTFYDPHTINRALLFIKAVKEVVKKYFSLDYFYETPQVIEEARSLGCGVVVPHPEQFWPILLADYDIDGYEVWNPQSREFTEFLIQTVVKKNQYPQISKHPLLVFMGDDTHMGEKIKDFDKQDVEKASREIGYQAAWSDPGVQKSLVFGHFRKDRIIQEYRQRLLNP